MVTDTWPPPPSRIPQRQLNNMSEAQELYTIACNLMDHEVLKLVLQLPPFEKRQWIGTNEKWIIKRIRDLTTSKYLK